MKNILDCGSACDQGTGVPSAPSRFSSCGSHFCPRILSLAVQGGYMKPLALYSAPLG